MNLELPAYELWTSTSSSAHLEHALPSFVNLRKLDLRLSDLASYHRMLPILNALPLLTNFALIFPSSSPSSSIHLDLNPLPPTLKYIYLAWSAPMKFEVVFPFAKKRRREMGCEVTPNDEAWSGDERGVWDAWEGVGV